MAAGRVTRVAPERLWQRLLQNRRGAVVAHTVRRETDAVICRLRFRLLRAGTPTGPAAYWPVRIRDAAPDGTTALRLAAARRPDVVLLDLGLPDMDGVAVIKGLRGWSRVPILVLSARQASEEKVAALDAGADDYITKPFSMAELLARLRAAVRRTEDTPLVPETTLVETDGFTLDLLAKKVVRDGRDVRLTPTEWHLLEILVTNPGRLITQKYLLQEVWGVPQRRRTTCASTWPNSAASWRSIPPTPAV